jgi:hypothetical protein
MVFIILHILYAIQCVVEARLETVYIEMKNPNMMGYDKLNKEEHFWSAVYYLTHIAATTYIVLQLTGLSWHVVVVVVSLLAVRRIFFDNSLKLFRRRPIRIIEGNMWLDVLARKILGRNGGYVDAFLMAGITIVSYFLTHKVFQ